MSAKKRPMKAGDGDERHGTLNGYVNQGCRCDECREANRAYNMARRQERADGKSISEWSRQRGHTGGPRKHNASTYSNWKCRCGECADAYAAYRRQRGTSPGRSHVCDAPFPVQEGDLWTCPRCRTHFKGGVVDHPKLGKAMGWSSL